MKKLNTIIITTLIAIGAAIGCTSSKSINNNNMKAFTVDQVNDAHSKVKSGADFPAYIRDLKELGVVFYKTYVTDGHTDVHGADGYKIIKPAKYEPLAIADQSNITQFKFDLKEHQQGKTDYPTFIKMCAGFGIEYWIVSLDKMTCTYFDKSGNEVLVEQIPEA